MPCAIGFKDELFSVPPGLHASQPPRFPASLLIIFISIHISPKLVIGVYFFNSPNNQPKVYKVKTEINKPTLQGRRFDGFNSKHRLGNLKEKGDAHQDQQSAPDQLNMYFVLIHH
jgi:hypothetical protein